MRRLLYIFLITFWSFSCSANVSNLITPAEYFVNHVWYILEIKQQLPKYRKVGIIGISGIGKTQLARTYADRYKDQYSIIWFLDCDNDLNEEFIKLAKAINIDVGKTIVSEDRKYAKSSVLEYIAPKQNWLIVLDNIKIKNKVDNTNIIKEISTLEHNGHIIFCSQDGGMFSNQLVLTHLEKKDSMKLIQNIADDMDIQISEALADTFHGYPVLIAQGAMFLKNNKFMTVEEYKKIIMKSDDKIKTHIQLVLEHLPKSSQHLLHQISLINNQRFSKQFLSIITANKASLIEDIYNLTRFGIINQIVHDKDNPIFEMHDMVALSVRELTLKSENKSYLEHIIEKFIDTIPKSVNGGHLFRNHITIYENLITILYYANIYEPNIYDLMHLRQQLLTNYLNLRDFYHAREMIKWFDDNDKANKFILLLMTDSEKGIYSIYLRTIGALYLNMSNYHKSIRYLKKAEEVFNTINEYDNQKHDLLYLLSRNYAFLGKCNDVNASIQKMEVIFNAGAVPKSDMDLLYLAKACLAYIQGQYEDAILLVNDADNMAIENGMKEDNILFTSSYILKSSSLNFLYKYNDAYLLANKLYNIYIAAKQESSSAMGRIFAEMARAEAGLGQLDESLQHSNQAIKILIADKDRNPEDDVTLSFDTDLAMAFVARGNAFFKMSKFVDAIDAYMNATRIFENTISVNDIHNLDVLSYIYAEGAKSAFRAKDNKYLDFFYKQRLLWYYGADHLRTKDVQKYCKLPDKT